MHAAVSSIGMVEMPLLVLPSYFPYSFATRILMVIWNFEKTDILNEPLSVEIGLAV